MQSEDKDIIYNVISDMIGFKTVIENHIANQGEILIRSMEGQQFVTLARRINLDGELECEFPSFETIAAPLGSKITVDFYFESDRYHFESTLNYKSTYFTVPLPPTIFQQQKRSQFRYSVPEDYYSSFLLRTAEATEIQHKGRIIDLSLEGCAIEWNESIPNFGRQTAIGGDLTLGNGMPFYVRGIVCFKIIRDKSLRIGLEFMGLNPTSEAALRQSIAKLQKDIFAKNN